MRPCLGALWADVRDFEFEVAGIVVTTRRQLRRHGRNAFEIGRDYGRSPEV